MAQYKHFVKILGALHVQVVFGFFAKTLIFDLGQKPPIRNFLCGLCREPPLEAACKISAFYLKF